MQIYELNFNLQCFIIFKVLAVPSVTELTEVIIMDEISDYRKSSRMLCFPVFHLEHSTVRGVRPDCFSLKNVIRAWNTCKVSKKLYFVLI